jgi:hypothetical protein
MPRAESYNQTFQLHTFTKVQLNKPTLIIYPDPAFGAGGGTAWSWEIYDVAAATIISSGVETFGPVTFNNYREVLIDDVTYVLGKIYRVRIFNNALALVDEWYFITYSSDFAGTAPINLALINGNIARIAGLLGLNQVITHDEHDKGVPTKTTIDLYDGDPNDPGSTVIYQYEQRKFVDPQYRVDGEISKRVL